MRFPRGAEPSLRYGSAPSELWRSGNSRTRRKSDRLACKRRCSPPFCSKVDATRHRLGCRPSTSDALKKGVFGHHCLRRLTLHSSPLLSCCPWLWRTPANSLDRQTRRLPLAGPKEFTGAALALRADKSRPKSYNRRQERWILKIKTFRICPSFTPPHFDKLDILSFGTRSLTLWH